MFKVNPKKVLILSNFKKNLKDKSSKFKLTLNWYERVTHT